MARVDFGPFALGLLVFSDPDQVRVLDQFGKTRAGSPQPRSVFTWLL